MSPTSHQRNGSTIFDVPSHRSSVSSVRLLLVTLPGERVNRAGFGGGLRQLVFSPNTAEGLRGASPGRIVASSDPYS